MKHARKNRKEKQRRVQKVEGENRKSTKVRKKKVGGYRKWEESKEEKSYKR